MSATADAVGLPADLAARLADPATPDADVATWAGAADAAGAALIAAAHDRILRAPAILSRLFGNPRAPMAAVNQDPAALKQLEGATLALRGIVSHVASNDSLEKLSHEVRGLSGKVDQVTGSSNDATVTQTDDSTGSDPINVSTVEQSGSGNHANVSQNTATIAIQTRSDVNQSGNGNTANVTQVDNNLSAPAADPAQYHDVVRGDTLSAISKKYYGDANKYNAIFEANKPMLTHPDKIYPGQKLRIPKL